MDMDVACYNHFKTTSVSKDSIKKEKDSVKIIEFVIPCYNEENCIRSLLIEVENVFSTIENYSYSILFVNDGSTDGTLKELHRLKTEYEERVNYISFSRNFGKESAIFAGLSNSKGDLVVLMDADLQHPPKLIPEMIKAIEEGYDCCGARRVTRKGEPPIRSMFSKMYYRLINKVTSMNLVPGGSDFRMMTRQMVDAVVRLTEKERFIKGILSWVGFDTKWIEYENVERLAGESKWSFWGLVRYAYSGFIAFATAPLRAVIYMGGIITIVAIIYAIRMFILALLYGTARTGYTTIVLLLLFFGGVIITILGFIGEYIARIYMELKQRPIYIEKENTTHK